MPALGFGTLIPDAALTRTAARDALDAGFRHFDCAERYRNEREVGDALQAGLAANGIARENIFVTAKLWNSNHRPERVEPAFEASLHRLSIKYLDLYLVHTPIFLMAAPQDFTRQGIAYATSQGAPLASIGVPVMGIVSLAGGLSVLLGYRARIGAWLMVLFLVVVTPVMHKFWGLTDPAMAQLQLIMFLKNLLILGAALLITQFGAGPLSLDARRSM